MFSDHLQNSMEILQIQSSYEEHSTSLIIKMLSKTAILYIFYNQMGTDVKQRQDECWQES